VKIWKNGDLDHVLIGPGGLFCISTKTNRGLYTIGQNGTYLLNGEETDHIHNAQRLALQLKDSLKGIIDHVPWIQAVLIAPISYIGFGTYQERAWVLHKENLPDVFEKAQRKLTTDEVRRFANAVKTIADKGRGL
jgi:hypothetical protein